MCGRYLFDITNEELKEIAKSVEDNLNMDSIKTKEIYPSNYAPIYIKNNDILKIVMGKWGFPKWDKKSIIINARVENIEYKKMFKNLVIKNRCIIPASGFYEWKRDVNNKRYKDKYIFTKPNSLLYMAGLYNEITDEIKSEQMSLFDNYDKDEKLTYIVYIILTKDADKSVINIHDRMPVVFTKEEISEWLGGCNMERLINKNNTELSYQIV